MSAKPLTRNRSRGTRRRRVDVAANRRQYSLFDAVPLAPGADARHFRRQIELCERLLRALHQPELVEIIGRLHDEYEATATRIEMAGDATATRT